MKVIPLEDRMIDSFIPEHQEKLKMFVDDAPLINTADWMKQIYAMCEENLDTVTRLIQGEIPTDIITLPYFVIQKDDFLNVFVAKSRQNQPILEVAIIIAIHRIFKKLKNVHRALDYLIAMGFRPLPTKHYHRTIQAADKVDAMRASLETIEHRINTIQEHVVTEEMLDKMLEPDRELFKVLSVHAKESMLSDKEFLSFMANAIEPFLNQKPAE